MASEFENYFKEGHPTYNLLKRITDYIILQDMVHRASYTELATLIWFF
jgi:hypothetical protein